MCLRDQTFRVLLEHVIYEVARNWQPDQMFPFRFTCHFQFPSPKLTIFAILCLYVACKMRKITALTWEISSWRLVEKFHISAFPMYYSLYNWIGEHEITKLKKKYLRRIQKKEHKNQYKKTWITWNDTKWTIWYFQQCACAIYFAPYRMKTTRTQQGVWALKWVSFLERVRNCQKCSTLVHTWAYHTEKITRRLFYIYRNWYHLWVKLSGWMGSV